MAQVLSPGELSKGRKNFMLFVLINNYSYYTLAGNIITLLALRMNAGNLVVGIVASFIYISYLFLVPGRVLIRKIGTIKLMYRYYVLRTLLMIPIMALPLCFTRIPQAAGFGILILFSFLFNAARGIHITADNPILAELGGENEKGGFLSRTLVVSYFVCMASALITYFLLGKTPPLYIYAIILGTGIAAGLVAARFLKGIPEPSNAGAESGHLFASFREAVKQPNLRTYFILLFLCFICSSMITPFAVVYLAKVYGAGDNHIMLFTLAGNAGSLCMALFSGFIIDRLGAKPLYFAFAVITLATLVPAIMGVRTAGTAALILFGCLLFFFQMMGTSGTYNAGRAYLLSALRKKDQLNFGVIYFVVIGLAGGIGSFLGGLIIDIFITRGFSLMASFRFFFGIVAAVYAVIVLLIGRLRNTAPYSMKSALLSLFTPRDLRTLSLLKKLDETKSHKEEKEVIQALRSLPSTLSIENLLEKLKSPSFEIRVESLEALHFFPATEEVKEALLSEVKNHPFTTGHMAAEILGEQKAHEAVKVLRQAIKSPDYLLAGKSMAALARLNDRESIKEIGTIFIKTKNPMLIIYGAKALEGYGNIGSLPILIGKLKEKPFPFIRDEIILATAGLIGVFDWFYRYYAVFLDKAGTGILMLRDDVNDERFPVPSPFRDQVNGLLDVLLNRQAEYAKEFFSILAALKEAGKAPPEQYEIIFGGLKSHKILPLVRYRFLTGALLVRHLKPSA